MKYISTDSSQIELRVQSNSLSSIFKIIFRNMPFYVSTEMSARKRDFE